MANGPEAPQSSRAPTPADVARIAAKLNALGARYAVVGGFAMAHYGLVRPTMDLDLLVDPDSENIALVREALSILEDRAVLDMKTDEVARYNVVRIADEIVVDLIARAAHVSFVDIAGHIEEGEILGVRIPYPTPEWLLETKRTLRDKDVPDRNYLQELIRRSKLE